MGSSESSDFDLLAEFKTVLTTVAAATSKEAVLPAVKKAQETWSQRIDQVAKSHLSGLDESRKGLSEKTIEFQKLLDRCRSELGESYKLLQDILNRSDFGKEAQRFGDLFNKGMADIRTGVETLAKGESEINRQFEALTEFTTQTQRTLNDLTVQLQADLKQNEVSLSALQLALQKTAQSNEELKRQNNDLSSEIKKLQGVLQDRIDQSSDKMVRQSETSASRLAQAVDTAMKSIKTDQGQGKVLIQKLIQGLETGQSTVLNHLQSEQLPLIRQTKVLSVAALTVAIIAALGVATLIALPFIR